MSIARDVLSDSDVKSWPMLIGGDWVEAAGHAWIDVGSPARRDHVIARVPRGGAADVEAAVRAARTAFPAWSGLHFLERQKALLALAELVELHQDELAELTALDTGNALVPQARPEVRTVASLFRYFGGVAGEFKGTVLPAGNDQLQYTRREPLGVVGAILPWNSPLMIAGMKLPAALAAGNTLVVKPAEDAPLAILALAELLTQVLPPGVVNVVTGTGEDAGSALVSHRGVDKVSFTGSTEVGRVVAGVAGERLAHVSLELGGKNPSIVFPSAAAPERLAETVSGVLTAMRFTRQGQSCTAGSRLFVHVDVYEEVLEELVAQVQRLKVGDPMDEATQMGALINQKQLETVQQYVREARELPGVRVLLDGSDYCPAGLDGYFQGPTILADVDRDWRVAREEVFGPVLVVVPWSELDDVIEMANDSHYGLAAFVWSDVLSEALTTADRLEAGWIQVNQGGGQVPGQSYGGYKESGVGREFSIEGAIESFTQIKQVNVRVR